MFRIKESILAEEANESFRGVSIMIRGEKIYLRPIQKSDLTYLYQWKNDEETFMYLGGGFLPTSIDQLEKWMDVMIDTTGRDKRFIICDNDGSPKGMVGLYDIEWIHRTCEIGVYIGDKDAKGKGYGKEACLLTEKYAKKYLNLRKIKLSVVSDNKRALNMWESLGYKKVGEYIAERYIKGAYRNLTIMEKFID
ncbi:MAG TPA: GNAT family N-acetyltransferase [Firmicutes bacterium]|nr:GNAT family N-acetyltransferase [Bacillota bacterium]